MTDKSAAEPLYSLIHRIRRPATLRELMAACLRSIYMGDPFSVDQGKLPPAPQELFEEVSVTETTISDVRCVIYSPNKSAPSLPVMLYMHGGGFVIGCSEDTDYITRMLCHMNRMIVVSVNYRLAPETVFPGALDDCEKVLASVMRQGSQLGIDSTSLYIAGDSAGATLAAALSYRLHQRQQSVKGLILLAPWLDMEVEAYDSYNRLAPTGVVFDAAFLGYARAAYVGFDQWKNPQVSPIFFPVMDMPPTIALIGAEDPFVDQALKLRQRAHNSNCDHVEVVTLGCRIVSTHFQACFLKNKIASTGLPTSSTRSQKKGLQRLNLLRANRELNCKPKGEQ